VPSIELERPGCGLCGGTSFDAVYDDCQDVVYRVPGPRFAVVRCRDCGLAQTSPRPTPEAMGRYYGDNYASWEADGPPRARTSRVRAAFRIPNRKRFGDPDDWPAPPRPGARLLEVGAGAGEALREMSRRGWDAWGIEAHERPGLDEGATGGARVIVAPAESAELPDSHFDLIRFSHSLEHMHDPLAGVRNAARWLRPAGAVRISLPNFDSRERRVFGRYWNGLDVPRHLFHFTPATLGRLLEAAGLRTVSVRTQFQGSSMGGSLQHVAAQLGRGRPYRPSGPVYKAGVPFGWLASGLRNGAFLVVDARPQA
jgi:SAM-dependent methyltransferase